MFLATLLSLTSIAPAADDWPGWRGPGGSGVASGSPPVEWSEEQNVRWKAPIPGRGSSCPVVWGQRVYVTTAMGTGNVADVQEEPTEGERRGRRPRPPIEEQDFLVIALDRSDGSEVWRRKVSTATPHQSTHTDGNYASPTLATNGEVVIASFGSFGIYALTADGEPLWQTDLGDLTILMSFGEGSSPVLYGHTLVVNWDHEGESFLTALHTRTGEERWRVPRAAGTTWLTPTILTVGGKPQVVLPGYQTIAYDLETGKELWSHGEPVGGRRGSGLISSAVQHEGLVLFSTGARMGELRALRPPAEDEANAELVWVVEGDTPHVPSPIVVDGRLYVTKADSGILSAFDAASGERLYGPERLQGVTTMYASPVAADGRLYLAGRDGTVEVVRIGEEIETLAVNELEDGFDASPAIAGDELFLRGREYVYCIAEGR